MYVAELRADELDKLEIVDVSNEATLAGQPAFRIRFAYRSPPLYGGTVIEQEVIGTAVAHGLLLAILRAPRLHYFENALGEFRQAAATVELAPRSILTR